LKAILDQATDNDRFVAYNLLQNAAVAIEGVALLSRHRNGYCNGKKGKTYIRESMMLNGSQVFNTYQERNLRYSQIVPIMFEEKIQVLIYPLKSIFILKLELTNFVLARRRVS
jgi:fumarate hydratase class I